MSGCNFSSHFVHCNDNTFSIVSYHVIEKKSTGQNKEQQFFEKV